VRRDYTFRWDGKLYEIVRQAIRPGLRGADERVQKRLDGTLAVRPPSRPPSNRRLATPPPRFRGFDGLPLTLDFDTPIVSAIADITPLY
jgi:hypothetical protein